MDTKRVPRYISLFLAVSLLLVASPIQAGASRISRGDVEAILNAFTTGGRVILSGPSDMSRFHAAPADFFGSNGAIRPFTPWDQAHFCEEDWHVILITGFAGGDRSYSLQDAKEYLDGVKFSFTLDGSELPTVRTPIKRYLNPAFWGWDEAYGFQEGKIMDPDSLAVGEHQLRVDEENPVYGDAVYEISFFIDPAGSGACQ